MNQELLLTDTVTVKVAVAVVLISNYKLDFYKQQYKCYETSI